MNRYVRFLTLLLAASASGGCANTELRISVDQYDEDPRVEMPMTPRKARQLVADLHTLRSEARTDINLRIELARDSVATYRSGWEIVGKDKSRIEDLEDRLRQYSQSLETNFASYDKKVESAVAALRRYVKSYRTKYQKVQADKICNQPEEKSSWARLFTGPAKSADKGDDCILREIRDDVLKEETLALEKTSDAITSFHAVGSSTEAFRCDWVGLEHALNAAYFTASINGNEELQSLLLRLGENIADRIRSLATGIAASGRPLPVNALRSPHTPTTLAGSSLAIANELETLRNDLPETATSRAALSNLITGTSRFIELIERLQDPGDPIWRIVTDPDNEGHWNRRIVETFFYAEGDAGVVVVRDDPMRYRVQSARNNPQALILGQLEISRSVANAAISIAGAAGGLPTSSLASSTAGSTTASGVGTTSDGYALRTARAEAWERQRTIALASLQRYLRALATNIDELRQDDEDGLARQTLRLKSVLSGHRPLLEISANE